MEKRRADEKQRLSTSLLGTTLAFLRSSGLCAFSFFRQVRGSNLRRQLHIGIRCRSVCRRPHVSRLLELTFFLRRRHGTKNPNSILFTMSDAFQGLDYWAGESNSKRRSGSLTPSHQASCRAPGTPTSHSTCTSSMSSIHQLLADADLYAARHSTRPRSLSTIRSESRTNALSELRLPGAYSSPALPAPADSFQRSEKRIRTIVGEVCRPLLLASQI